MSSASKPLDTPVALTALIVTGALGVSAFLVLPAIVVGLRTDLGFSQQQVGLMATAQLIGLGVGSVCCLWLLPRLSWQGLARVGVTGLLLGDLACIFVTDYGVFLALRALGGLAGGIAISFVAYALGQTQAVDRNFGFFVGYQVLFSMAGVYGFPSVNEAFGVAGIFATLCAIELFTLLVLIRLIPDRRWEAPTVSGEGNDQFSWLLCGVVFIGLIFFFTGLGGFWTYIGPIGIDVGGLTQQQTGTALSLGLIGGLVGSYGAAALNVRIGRAIPLVFACGMQLVALGVLYGDFTYLGFVAAAALFSLGWYMYVPYQFGLLAVFDRDGRPMVLLNAVAGLGAGIGPAIVGSMLSEGYAPVFQLTAVFLTLSIAFLLGAMLIGRSRLAVAPAG